MKRSTANETAFWICGLRQLRFVAWCSRLSVIDSFIWQAQLSQQAARQPETTAKQAARQLGRQSVRQAGKPRVALVIHFSFNTKWLPAARVRNSAQHSSARRNDSLDCAPGNDIIIYVGVVVVVGTLLLRVLGAWCLALALGCSLVSLWLDFMVNTPATSSSSSTNTHTHTHTNIYEHFHTSDHLVGVIAVRFACYLEADHMNTHTHTPAYTHILAKHRVEHQPRAGQIQTSYIRVVVYVFCCWSPCSSRLTWAWKLQLLPVASCLRSASNFGYTSSSSSSAAVPKLSSGEKAKLSLIRSACLLGEGVAERGRDRDDTD